MALIIHRRLTRINDMNSVGLAVLKERLSAYLKKVKSGQEILITERGKPIAKLVPLESASNSSKRRERLAEQGLLCLGKGKVRSLLRSPPEGEAVGESILAALLSERDEGR